MAVVGNYYKIPISAGIIFIYRDRTTYKAAVISYGLGRSKTKFGSYIFDPLKH